jgi:hypothetical protein
MVVRSHFAEESENGLRAKIDLAEPRKIDSSEAP